MAIVTAAAFADFCGKSPAWVSKQIAAGLPLAVEGENGLAHQIDSGEAIGWLLKQAAGDERTATARLKSAQAEKAENENRVRAGELVTLGMYQNALVELASEMIRAISALPGRLAGELAGITDPALMRARLIDEFSTIRNSLAGHCQGFAERIAELDRGVVAAGQDSPGASDNDARSLG